MRGALALLLAACLATGVPLFGAEPTAPPYIARFDGDRAAAVSYTFDDGMRDQYTVAVPMLNEVGFKGTFFVIPGATPEDTATALQNDGKRRAWGGITWPELAEMAAAGHEIANHTWSHRNLKTLSAEEVEQQLQQAHEAIATRLGQPPVTVAFPFNASTPEVRAAVEKHYLAYRSYQTGISAGTTAEVLQSWLEKQIAEKRWGVLMFHGIGRGYAALTNPEILRTHLRYVKGQEDKVWVDTFANVARYSRLRDSAALQVSSIPGGLSLELSSTPSNEQLNLPLTLVVPAPGVKKARAERGGQPLQVVLKEGKILLRVQPGAHPILLTWS